MSFEDRGDLECQPKPLRIRSESGTEDVHYPLLYEGLPKEAELYAEKELNETKDNKAEGIRRLKEYMEREKIACPDDKILILVLRSCKYNFKKSERKLKQFLKLREFTCDKLAQMDLAIISRLLEDCIFVCLPYRDKHGRLIVYTSPSLSISKYKFEDIMICGLASTLYFLTFPMNSIYGFIHLGECSTPHLPIFYPVLKLAKMVFTIMKDLPVRLAGIELFNEHFLCHWAIYMLRPFMPDKISKRVTLHGSGFDSVHKIFHPAILPYEIGGTVGPLSAQHYKEELMSFIEKLRNENLAKDMI